jgi:hypothetical protein
MSAMSQRVGKLSEGINLFATPKEPQPAPEPVVFRDPVFSYDKVAPDVAARARKAAEDIRSLQQVTIMDIGQALLAVKAEMAHGTFGAWLDAEFSMSVRSAENYMNAAKFLQGKSETVALLPPTAVYALASKDADPVVVAEVLAEVEGGKIIPAGEVRDRLAGATKARLAAAAVKTAEQIKADKENEKRRRAAQAARDKKWEEEQQSAEMHRKQTADKAAAFLIEVLSPESIQQLKNLMVGTHWSAVSDAISTQLFTARGGAQ